MQILHTIHLFSDAWFLCQGPSEEDPGDPCPDVAHHRSLASHHQVGRGLLLHLRLALHVCHLIGKAVLVIREKKSLELFRFTAYLNCLRN